MSAAELEQYIGEYALSPSNRITVTTGGNTFFLKVVKAKIQFLRSGEGKVNALLRHQGG